MMFKKPGLAAVLISVLMLSMPAAVPAFAQSDNSGHQSKPSPLVPAVGSLSASASSAQTLPNTVSPGTSADSTTQTNPVPRTDCQGGACDAAQPRISIATPAPAAAPWPVQDRISWAANLILVLIAYAGILLAVSLLRKIERYTRDAEFAAQAATDSARAALLLAEAQQRAERPWILVTAEPEHGNPNSFNVVAANRGKSPARITSLTDGLAFLADESKLASAPVRKSSGPPTPVVAMILLPGESTILKSIRRDDLKTLCETPEQLKRVEEWEERIYLLGTVKYADLLSRENASTYETAWCCWYIHGRQRSGLVMAGPAELNRHT